MLAESLLLELGKCKVGKIGPEHQLNSRHEEDESEKLGLRPCVLVEENDSTVSSCCGLPSQRKWRGEVRGREARLNE